MIQKERIKALNKKEMEKGAYVFTGNSMQMNM
jgi:hypothetical protein